MVSAEIVVALDHFLSTAGQHIRRSPQIDCDADDRAPTSTDFRRGLACARSPAPSELAPNVSRSLRSEAGAPKPHRRAAGLESRAATTAAFDGWWLPDAPPHPVFAAMRKADPPPRRSGLYICRHPKPFPMTIKAGGLKITAPAETLLACARDLGILDVVILADSALRQRDVTLTELKIAANQRRRGAPMGRPWDNRRLQAWEELLNESMCRRPGRTRALRRWSRAL
jgi:hypothetical protein